LWGLWLGWAWFWFCNPFFLEVGECKHLRHSIWQFNIINASTFRDYVGNYKITSATCSTADGPQQVCKHNNKETISIVMIGQNPCVQFGENGGWSMQYCMITQGVSSTSPAYDSNDWHGTVRYNIEFNSDGSAPSFVWRVYDNPTYPKAYGKPIVRKGPGRQVLFNFYLWR
jgi:hypothetical protein